MVGIIPHLPLASMWYAFSTSNITGKVIIFILLAASVYVWTIMVSKASELKKARAISDRFIQAYRQSKQPLALFLLKKQAPDSPVFNVYEKACMAVGLEIESRDDRYGGGLAPGDSAPTLNQAQLGAVRNAAEREVADQVLKLEDQMGTLATAVSASPLLGLLGTVWGVMDSFSGMAVQNSANLSAVAPGIAGALLTTVVALVVALPSAIGYNNLTSKIRRLTVNMDNFVDELIADMQRSLLED